MITAKVASRTCLPPTPSHTLPHPPTPSHTLPHPSTPSHTLAQGYIKNVVVWYASSQRQRTPGNFLSTNYVEEEERVTLTEGGRITVEEGRRITVEEGGRITVEEGGRVALKEGGKINS